MCLPLPLHASSLRLVHKGVCILFGVPAPSYNVAILEITLGLKPTSAPAVSSVLLWCILLGIPYILAIIAHSGTEAFLLSLPHSTNLLTHGL